MSSDSSGVSSQSDGEAEEWDEDAPGPAAAPAAAKGTKRERVEAAADAEDGEALKPKKSRKKATKKRKDFDATRTVFAGKVPYAAEEDDIRTFFSECGTITRLRMLLAANKKFNGAVFVEFATAAEASKALAMDGETFLKRQIRVNMAELKPDASGAQSGFKVYVGNLAFTTSEKLLRAIFGHCGDIIKIKLPLWRDTGRLRGFAVIDMDTAAARERALKLNGMKVEGREITVEAMQKPDKSAKKARKSNATRGSKTIKLATK